MCLPKPQATSSTLLFSLIKCDQRVIHSEGAESVCGDAVEGVVMVLRRYRESESQKQAHIWLLSMTMKSGWAYRLNTANNIKNTTTHRPHLPVDPVVERKSGMAQSLALDSRFFDR
jgi:hypothetical protein